MAEEGRMRQPPSREQGQPEECVGLRGQGAGGRLVARKQKKLLQSAGKDSVRTYCVPGTQLLCQELS